MENANDRKRAVIIGAGPAGLTAALELLRRSDVEPVVVERDGVVGGISRTVRYKGRCLDLGGHRYFTKSDAVMEMWRELLPVEDGATHCAESEDDVMMVRNRLSRIYFLGRFFDYPVSLSWRTVRNLGLRRFLGIVSDYVRIRCFPIREERSLEDFYINRFGRRLYETFFRDYTRKVWGVECCEISPEWGNQRVRGLSVRAAVVHAVRSVCRRTPDRKEVETSLIERFLYPKFGAGHIWEVAAKRITDGGGTVLLGSRVVSIHADKDRITGVTVRSADGRYRRIDCDWLISSMPVRDLVASMDVPVPDNVRRVAEDLVYRDFMTVGMSLRRMKVAAEHGSRYCPDTWIYVQERDVMAGRIQIFNNWSPYMVGDDDTAWIGVEYFVDEGGRYWNMPDDEFIRMAACEMERIGIIDRADLLDAVVVRVPKAYPAYFGSYDRIGEIRKWMDGIANLFPVGRNGMHRYNNMDHSMLTALAAVECIVSGDISGKSAIWRVNTESDYLEGKRGGGKS